MQNHPQANIRFFENSKKQEELVRTKPEVLGPEHEFSVVDSDPTVLPIVDEILKDFHGRIVNSEMWRVHIWKRAAIACYGNKTQHALHLPSSLRDQGSLSDLIRERVLRRVQRTDFEEAVVSVYSRLTESLMDN